MKLALKIVRYILTWPAFLGYLFPLLTFALFMSRDLHMGERGAAVAESWRFYSFVRASTERRTTSPRFLSEMLLCNASSTARFS